MYHCITVSRNCQAILNVTMCFLISSVMTHLPFSATKTQDSAIHWPSMSASKTSNEEISKTPDLVSCKSNSCQDTTKRTHLSILSRSHCPDFLGYLKKLHLVSVCSGDLPSTQEACTFTSELKMRTLNCFCNQLRFFRKSQTFSFRGVGTPPPCLHWSYAALRR